MENTNHVTADANESMERNLISNESTIFVSYGLVGAILLFAAAGYLLDRWLDSSPWLLLGGLLTGLAVGFFGLLRAVRRRSL
jgi:F0F1-type ATP synthase assembly protein I